MQATSFRANGQWGSVEQAVTIALGYPWELDGKPLLLKTPHTQVIVHGKMKLGLTWKLIPIDQLSSYQKILYMHPQQSFQMWTLHMIIDLTRAKLRLRACVFPVLWGTSPLSPCGSHLRLFCLFADSCLRGPPGHPLSAPTSFSCSGHTSLLFLIAPHGYQPLQVCLASSWSCQDYAPPSFVILI